MHLALQTTLSNLVNLGLTRNGVVNASLVQLPRNHNKAAIYWLLILLTPICTRGSTVNDAYCKARQLAHHKAILQSTNDFFIIGIILQNVLKKTPSTFSVSQVRYVLIISYSKLLSTYLVLHSFKKHIRLFLYFVVCFVALSVSGILTTECQ
jgi:hypothetical protein